MFQSPVLGWSCSGFTSVQYVLLQLSRAPPCSVQPSLWPGFSLRSGAFTRLRPVRDHAHGHFKKMCAELLHVKGKQVLPPQPSLWDSWLTSQLDTCTLCLQRHRAQAVVILAVKALLRDMASLSVTEYLKALLLWADHRGSDVQIRTELVQEGSAQVALYPAFAWR